MKDDRSSKPRRKASDEGFRKPRTKSAAEGFLKPARAGERPAPRFARKPRSDEGADFSDPYRSAQRPPRTREFGGGRAERGTFAERGARGFTVTLDPDIARVFRGDASVNRALRLVLQLVQVVQGPPARPARAGGAEGSERPRRGYQGSPEARGFTRKPRFGEDESE